MCTFGRRDLEIGEFFPQFFPFSCILGMYLIDLPTARHDGELLSSESKWVGEQEGEARVEESSTVLSRLVCGCVKSWRRIGGLRCPSASPLWD